MTRGWGTSRTLDNTRKEPRDTRKNQVAGQVLAETGSSQIQIPGWPVSWGPEAWMVVYKPGIAWASILGLEFFWGATESQSSSQGGAGGNQS